MRRRKWREKKGDRGELSQNHTVRQTSGEHAHNVYRWAHNILIFVTASAQQMTIQIPSS